MLNPLKTLAYEISQLASPTEEEVYEVLRRHFADPPTEILLPNSPKGKQRVTGDDIQITQIMGENGGYLVVGRLHIKAALQIDGIVMRQARNQQTLLRLAEIDIKNMILSKIYGDVAGKAKLAMMAMINDQRPATYTSVLQETAKSILTDLMGFTHVQVEPVAQQTTNEGDHG